MRDIFFSAGYFSLARFFVPRNQSAGYFFSDITHIRQKSQLVGSLGNITLATWPKTHGYRGKYLGKNYVNR